MLNVCSVSTGHLIKFNSANYALVHRGCLSLSDDKLYIHFKWWLRTKSLASKQFKTVRKWRALADVALNIVCFFKKIPLSHHQTDLLFSSTVIIMWNYDTGDVIRTYDYSVTVRKITSKEQEYIICNISFCDELPVSKFSHTQVTVESYSFLLYWSLFMSSLWCYFHCVNSIVLLFRFPVVNCL